MIFIKEVISMIQNPKTNNNGTLGGSNLYLNKTKPIRCLLVFLPGKTQTVVVTKKMIFPIKTE